MQKQRQHLIYAITAFLCPKPSRGLSEEKGVKKIKPYPVEFTELEIKQP